MTTLMPDTLADLILGTTSRYLGKEDKSWVDISTPYQKYLFARLMKSRDKNDVEDGGVDLRWPLQIDDLDTFEHSEIHHILNPQQKDLMVEAYEKWCLQRAHYVYSILENAFQGDGETEIFKLVKIRAHAMMNSYYKGMEHAMWMAPTSTTQRPRRPSGIPHWLQTSSANSGNFGFNGGNPSNFSSGAGNVSSLTVDAWKNGTFTYANLTDPDGIDKWVQAMDFCVFEAPDDFSQLDAGQAKWGLYTTYRNLQTLRKFVRNQNDNLGADVAAYRRGVLFRGVPVEWVPALDNSTSDAYVTNHPIYGVNWNTIQFYYQKGFKRKTLRPTPISDQPDGYKVVMLSSGQWRCINRRANFVAYDSSV